MEHIRFKILGPLEVTVDGQVVRLGGLQRRAVLAALLLEAGRVLSTDDLVGAIWRWDVPEDPVGVLHTHVHGLRRVLEPGRPKGTPPQMLVSSRAGSGMGYVLRVQPSQVDETHFLRLLDDGRHGLQNDHPNAAARTLRQALGLWRGSALADVVDWPFAVRHAARLEASRLVAVEAEIEAQFALGRHAHMLGHLRELVAEHPAHEGFRLQLALGLYRSRRREEAARVCREGLERLHGQGLDSKALQRLQQAILQQAPELKWKPLPSPIRPPRTSHINHRLLQLPPDIRDFTGRDESVAMLLELLGTPRDKKATAVVIAAISGKAGGGKTALALHVAHQLRTKFPNGTLYVDLQGTAAEPLDPSKVLIGFLVALGVTRQDVPEELEERVALYRAQLADRRMLIVLDNAGREAQVRPLLPSSAGCAVLVTSRARLTGLDASHSVIDVLEPDQAVELLGKIAGHQRVAAEPDAAQGIVGLCGYLPLAVRIAGARLAARPDWHLARLVRRLVDERTRLSELEAGDLEVRASFAFSYQAQDESTRRAFRLLALLEAPDFATWVPAALLDTGLAEAERLIDRLVDAHLLETLGEDATGQLRYRFHDLLRAFARERLDAEEPPDARQAALPRVLGAYLAHAEYAAALLEPGEPPIIDQRRGVWWAPQDLDEIRAVVQDPIQWFGAERANLVAMIEQAHNASLFETTWLLAAALVQFLDMGSHWSDWRHTHGLALDAARQAGSELAEAATLRNLAKLAHFQGSFEEALTGFNQCLTIFHRLAHRRGEAYSLRNLGMLHEEEGRFAEAIACLSKSRSASHELRSELGEALSLRGLGDAYQGTGRLTESVACYDACLPMFRRLRYRLGEASTLMGLGIVYSHQGRLDDAVACFQDCLPILAQLGHRRLHAYGLGHLAALYERQERLTEALACLDQAIPVLVEVRDHLRQAKMLDCRGAVLNRIGDQVGADSTWNQALAIFQRLGAPEAAEVQAQLDRAITVPAQPVS